MVAVAVGLGLPFGLGLNCLRESSQPDKPHPNCTSNFRDSHPAEPEPNANAFAVTHSGRNTHAKTNCCVELPGITLHRYQRA